MYILYMYCTFDSCELTLYMYIHFREDKIRGIIFEMIFRTGLSMYETDGPYGGRSCASTTHDHHFGEADSVYWQTRLQSELYVDLRKLNVFINQPDNYFYWGGSKSGMG